MNKELQARCRVVESIGTGVEQKAQLVLVLLGLKPAASLSIFPWNMTPLAVEKNLDKANLKYIRKRILKYSKAIAEYAVSNDYETARKLLNARSSTEFGRLYGYPETAIQAFESGKRYNGKLPKDIDLSIFRFAFSQEHFEQEFQVIRKWNQALLEYAPSLAHIWRDPIKVVQVI